MSSPAIFLLEDDLPLAETVAEFLEDNGFEVTSETHGDKALDTTYEKHFDLLLLDVNVPGLSGFELLQEIREREITTPAIFLTSLSGINDVETGYEAGCDDYLRKPFELRELLIRIKTLLKRGYFHHSSEAMAIAPGVTFDLQSQTVRLESGQESTLSSKESRLLTLFLQHPNELLSHEMIATHLWEFDEEASDSALRTYIKNLRKLIGKEKIVSYKRLGYRYTPK